MPINTGDVNVNVGRLQKIPDETSNNVRKSNTSVFGQGLEKIKNLFTRNMSNSSESRKHTVQKRESGNLAITTAEEEVEKVKDAVTKTAENIIKAKEKIKNLESKKTEIESKVTSAQQEVDEKSAKYEAANQQYENKVREREQKLLELNRNSKFGKLPFRQKTQNEGQEILEKLLKEESKLMEDMISKQTEFEKAEERLKITQNNLEIIKADLKTAQIEEKVADAEQKVSTIKLTYKSLELQYSKLKAQGKQENISTNRELSQLEADYIIPTRNEYQKALDSLEKAKEELQQIRNLSNA